MPKDGDLRMLGAADGFANALIDVRGYINRVDYYRIDPRHTRKLKAREAVLGPLRELEQKFAKSYTDCKAAYVKTT